jgi:light-regulated signal transduction histidine kinase (bacteriophytochrome)
MENEFEYLASRELSSTAIDDRAPAAVLASVASEQERGSVPIEDVAYAISHDLSQPLTTIAGFAGLLARRCSDRLSPEEEELIGFILRGTERMRTMIGDLVAFLRLTGEPHGLVECSHVVQRALDSLADTIAQAGGTVTVGPLPTVRGDSHLLEKLFTELISNALKFADAAPLRIEISAVDFEDCARFAITDNGIGIESARAERAFELFRRLHTTDSYTGNGMGLAICKRIVDWHGGRIWVEASPGGGSRFQFTIPRSA